MYPGNVEAAEQEASSKFWGGGVSDQIRNWRQNDFLVDISRHMPITNIVPGLIQRAGENYSQQENQIVGDSHPMMNDPSKPMTLNEQRRRLMLGQFSKATLFAQSSLGYNPMGNQLLNQYGQGNMVDQTKNDAFARVMMQDAFTNRLVPSVARGIEDGLFALMRNQHQAQQQAGGVGGANAANVPVGGLFGQLNPQQAGALLNLMQANLNARPAFP